MEGSSAQARAFIHVSAPGLTWPYDSLPRTLLAIVITRSASIEIISYRVTCVPITILVDEIRFLLGYIDLRFFTFCSLFYCGLFLVDRKKITRSKYYFAVFGYKVLNYAILISMHTKSFTFTHFLFLYLISY